MAKQTAVLFTRPTQSPDVICNAAEGATFVFCAKGLCIYYQLFHKALRLVFEFSFKSYWWIVYDFIFKLTEAQTNNIA